MPDLELVMTLRVEIAPALEVGEVGAGFRRVIPITGGSFEGQRSEARCCLAAQTGT
jgi:hypothetical protein